MITSSVTLLTYTIIEILTRYSTSNYNQQIRVGAILGAKIGFITQSTQELTITISIQRCNQVFSFTHHFCVCGRVGGGAVLGKSKVKGNGYIKALKS